MIDVARIMYLLRIVGTVWDSRKAANGSTCIDLASERILWTHSEYNVSRGTTNVIINRMSMVQVEDGFPLTESSYNLLASSFGLETCFCGCKSRRLSVT